MKRKKKKLSFIGLAFMLAFVFSFTLAEAADDFEEQTLIDNEECAVVITGIDEDNLWGYTLKVYLENKSSDVTYMFSIGDGAVNGLEDDPFFASEVAPGKKKNDEINFSSVSKYGIEEVTDIELGFRVYDSDDWLADKVVDETFHIYPLGEENAVRYEREPQESDIVLTDTDDVKMTVTGFEEDDIWGYTLNVFLENKTEREAMFTVDDASVNGYMLDPFWSKSVPAGDCAYSSMSWSDSKLEENGISEVSEIEMTVRVYDFDDWLADDFVRETVTVNPN